METDVNIPAVRDALNFAVGKLNEQSDFMSGVVKVIKATRQVCLQPYSFSFSCLGYLCFNALTSLTFNFNMLIHPK